MCWMCRTQFSNLLYIIDIFDTYIYIYIYALSRRFYPKRLTVHSGYKFFSARDILTILLIITMYLILSFNLYKSKGKNENLTEITLWIYYVVTLQAQVCF